ncbi:cytotoxic necrotizing factor Rho-activating domain-containing protein [Paraburkholderia rhizosphaerae]|uniref:cytotoxic necrotizing factor Rho-activating domain-containing protein n=1 Tax=Paraburkholderia rhizosphaerae TaxID=480658 RepID=UPI00366D543F
MRQVVKRPVSPVSVVDTTVPVDPHLQVKQGITTLKRLQGEGPINLTPTGDAAADTARIKQFGAPLRFYRNDSSETAVRTPSLIDKTDYRARRDVVAFGKGTDATSYVPEAKAYMGRGWASTPAQLSGTDILKLGAGKDGTTAMMLPFGQIRPGSTIIVTGGPMRGSTMLFAADRHGFYAYHAGASSNNPRWSVSEDGARSIANAYRAMHSGHDGWTTAHSGAGELVSIARQHPFSALIYNGEYSAEPGRKPLDERIDAPLHTTAGDPENPSHMMTFSYFEPGDVRSVGTAEAVISKDPSGQVTVQVLGERGKLDSMQTLDLHGGSVGFRYRSTYGATTSYTVERSKQS